MDSDGVKLDNVLSAWIVRVNSEYFTKALSSYQYIVQFYTIRVHYVALLTCGFCSIRLKLSGINGL